MFAYCNNSPVINADPAGCVSSRVIFPVCIDSGCKKLVTHANGNRGDELLQYVLNEFDMPSASGTVYVDVEYSGEHERTIYGDLGSIVTWTGFGCLVIGKASAKIAPFCPPLAPCLTMVAGVSIPLGEAATVAGAGLDLLNKVSSFPDGTYDQYTVTVSWVHVIPNYLEGLTIHKQISVTMYYIWNDASRTDDCWYLLDSKWQETATNMYR